MKIAQVVTYISPDGAFGGPARVALGQAEALSARGHDIHVFAAAPHREPQTYQRDGFTVRTFPAKRISRRLGFAGMYAPGLSKALRRDLTDFDAVHVHLARDLVTLPAARVARKGGSRVVLQPHGMIDESRHPLARPIDAWEVRPSLSNAAAVLTLTEREMADIAAIAPTAITTPIINGIARRAMPSLDMREDKVVFLARLHVRKRATEFVRMAEILVRRGCTSTFILAGPDEGQAAEVTELITSLNLASRVSWIGAVDPDNTDALLSSSRAYVLPSIGEVFPMSVLEAFRVGTPTVVTDSLGIADKCARYGAAIVTDGSAAALADAVQDILENRRRGDSLREGAQRFVESELSMDIVVDRLLRAYAPEVTC